MTEEPWSQSDPGDESDPVPPYACRECRGRRSVWFWRLRFSLFFGTPAFQQLQLRPCPYCTRS